MVKHYLKAGFSRINKFDFIYEFFLYRNRRQLEIDQVSFFEDILTSENYSPIFFLSTGRTGTEFFTNLLSNSSKVKVFHSPSELNYFPQSELILEGKIVYENYILNGLENDIINELSSQIFLSSREILLFKTYLHNKIYVETNNRITFLAPAIKKLIPNAKFVYLYRHPGEFIRSAIRRNYYNSKKNFHELGRIVPTKNDDYYDKWNGFDMIEKNAWLWNETNKFIENYLETINNNDYIKFNFNDLNVKNLQNLINFLNIDDISFETLERSINNPINVQLRGTFPKYEDWLEEDKNKVRKICKKLTDKYNFIL